MESSKKNKDENKILDEEKKIQEEKEFEEIKLTAWQSVKIFFSELLDLGKDTDRDATIEAVKKDISFKGHNALILAVQL